MADLNARIQRTVEEIMGNEALVGMLETEAARKMLDWGLAAAKGLVSKTMELDDFAAELAIMPRLKAIRQSMRAVGNWAAGSYSDPASRVQLRDRLLASLRVIFGEQADLPAAEKVDEVLDQVDDPGRAPHELVSRFIELVGEPK